MERGPDLLGSLTHTDNKDGRCCSPGLPPFADLQDWEKAHSEGLGVSSINQFSLFPCTGRASMGLKKQGGRQAKRTRGLGQNTPNKENTTTSLLPGKI